MKTAKDTNPVTKPQLDQMKSMIKEHLSNTKFFDSIKAIVAKDPKLANVDKNLLMEKLKNEGVLSEILQSIPIKKQSQKGNSLTGGTYYSKAKASLTRPMDDLDKEKRYLACKVVGGSAFVDFINPREDEFIFISCSFLNQRFQTQMANACTEPTFNENFTFEFSTESGYSVNIDPQSLLKLNTPLQISVLKQRKYERPVVLSTKTIDWRALLHCNSVEVNTELMPVDLKHKGSIGVLRVHLDMVPYLNKNEILLEDLVEKQMGLEKKFESEALQKFLEYSNEWWTEYKEIRASHKKRLVKIFAETDDRENSVYKPVCTLVSPMLADRIVESPNHAARFVSLIPFQRIESPGNERVEVWHSIQAFLARGCGDAEDHAVLLCNLLLGFGLDTYVCIGTNADGAHAWVLSRVHKGDGFGSEMCKTIFWESLTGQKFESSDARVHRFYRTISCVFNHKSFYANIQQDDRVSFSKYNFDDETKWKALSPEHIKMLPPARNVGTLMASTINPIEEEKIIEGVLKDKISQIRMSDKSLSTNWDNKLSYVLSTALVNYEYERIGGAGSGLAEEEFQSGIKNIVPEGHTFKAFPIQFLHFDIDKMIIALTKSKVGTEIINSRGDSVRHALRVKVIVYPENVCAVWVIIASRFKSLQQFFNFKIYN